MVGGGGVTVAGDLRDLLLINVETTERSRVEDLSFHFFKSGKQDSHRGLGGVGKGESSQMCQR